jgi:ABC-type multidrug transport system ATPase subunit
MYLEQSITLLGHNGAGKTTLIHYLLGFYTHLSNHPFLSHFESFIQTLSGQKVAYAPEKSLLTSTLSAKDYFNLYKKSSDAEIQNYLKSFHLSIHPKESIKKYSKGMQQRLQLALAFYSDPEVLFLDEPTSGLDPFGTQDIEKLIKQKNEDLHIVLSTHSLLFAYELQNEIWIMKEGKLVYRGHPDSYESLCEIFDATRPKKVL